MTEKILEMKEYLESGGFNVLVNEKIKHNQLLTRFVRDHHSTSVVLNGSGRIISQSYQSQYINPNDTWNQYYIITDDIKRESLDFKFNWLKDWNQNSYRKYFLKNKQLSFNDESLGMSLLETIFRSKTVVKGLQNIYTTVVHLMEVDSDFDFELIDLNLQIGYIKKSHNLSHIDIILIYPIIKTPDITNRHIIPKLKLGEDPSARDGIIYNIDDCLDRMLKQ